MANGIPKGMREVPEWMIRRLDEQFPNDAAAKALADAVEVKARGNPYRFLLSDKGEVCVQEGVRRVDVGNHAD